MYSEGPLSVVGTTGQGYRLSFTTFAKTWYIVVLFLIAITIITATPIIIKLFQSSNGFNISTHTVPQMKIEKVQTATQTSSPAVFEQKRQGNLRIERVDANATQTNVTAIQTTSTEETQTIENQLQSVFQQTQNYSLTEITVQLLTWILSIYLFVIITLRGHHAGQGETLSMGGAFLIGLKRLFKVIVVTILSAIPALLIIAGGIFLLAQIGTGKVSVITLSIITTAVSLYFFLAAPLAIIDNLSTVKSITKSCKLVWGNWWRSFFVYLFSTITLFIILWGLMWVARFLFPLILKMLIPLLGAKVFVVLFPLFIIIYLLLTAYFMAFFISVTLSLISDLKLRKQSDPITVSPNEDSTPLQ